MRRNSRIFISGGCHEACSGAYAFLLWDRNDASFVYSGNTVYADLYHRMPDSGLLSFLRMRSIQKIAEVREIRDCTENMKRKRGHVKRHVLSISSNYALSTKPERKQEVHTYIFLAPPLTLTLTDLTFAFQIALDLLWEWLTLFPK